MTSAARVLLVALAVVGLTGCSSSHHTSSTHPDLTDPRAQASAPVPGVTLPPGPLLDLVPTPSDVPAGMVPVVQGSGPRSLDVVAGYSGSGAVKAQAAQALRTHGFQAAYAAQYANQATGQVLSVVVTRFASTAGATADFSDDQKGTSGKILDEPQLGDGSSVTVQSIPGNNSGQLVLVRFQHAADTWVIAYEAAPTAAPAVPIGLAQTLLGRA